MEKKDLRIDAYIAKSAEFAQPILNHLRQIIHNACPEIVETIKWGFPHFDYKGTVCSMAAFKQHCAFGFWKASLMSDTHKLFDKEGNDAMGQLGQVKSLNDLPSDEILSHYIREAVQLNKEGKKIVSRVVNGEKKELEVPDYFSEALTSNEGARKTFESFSYSNRKDYVTWITEAKNEHTRNKRLETAIEWMAEGKIRNWKYVKK
jgi:uncharacterized protein YdeI (YjbR/CyaY-like superfamily)